MYIGAMYMNEINLSSWEAFEDQCRNLEKEYPLSKFLYRGQGDYNWPLSTTLERRGQELSLEEYHSLILEVNPEILSNTRRRLNLPFKVTHAGRLWTALKHTGSKLSTEYFRTILTAIRSLTNRAWTALSLADFKKFVSDKDMGLLLFAFGSIDFQDTYS